MIGTLHTFFVYSLRVLPGLLVITAVFVLFKPAKKWRPLFYILSFILLRDSMTPLGLWQLDSVKGLIWIRLSTDPLFLIGFGICSLLIALALYTFDRENREHLYWFKKRGWAGITGGIVTGILGAVIVALPFIVLYRFVGIDLRGGTVAPTLLLPILIFTLFGNLLEELLFRGYASAYLSKSQPLLFRAFATGLFFTLGHIFLATTVTGIGVPLLIFTLWEGTMAGVVGLRYGLIPATLTHGIAIFLLSSGLF